MTPFASAATNRDKSSGSSFGEAAHRSGTANYTIQRRWDEVGIAVIFNIGGNYDDIRNKLLCPPIPLCRNETFCRVAEVCDPLQSQ